MRSGGGSRCWVAVETEVAAARAGDGRRGAGQQAGCGWPRFLNALLGGTQEVSPMSSHPSIGNKRNFGVLNFSQNREKRGVGKF